MADWGESSFSDEEDALDEQEITSDHIMCLLDTRPNMFEEMSDGTTYFDLSLQLIMHLLKKKIIESDKNTVGLTLFGTKNKTNEDTPHENVYALVPLDVPSARGIRTVQELLELTDGHCGEVDYLNDTPWGGPITDDTTCPLKAALWTCTQTFVMQCGSDAKAMKRVWLFTNDDNPFNGSKDEEDRVVQIAKDASESGVEVQLFHLNRKSKGEFDVRKFYERILVIDDTTDFLEDKVQGADSLQQLMDRTNRKVHRKRCLARIPLVISDPESAGGMDVPKLSIAMQLIITTAATKQTAIQLDGTTNQPVKAHTKMLCETTGAYLDEFDIRTYQEVGGHNERAYISKTEMNSMKKWSDPGITLLGFLPQSWLKSWYNVRSPYFLYPDEINVKGATVAAHALLQAMVERKRIAVARFVRTASSAPQLVAILPQPENCDEEDGTQLDPPGFNMIVLPFADDLRDVQLEQEMSQPSEAAIESAKKLVKAISLNMRTSADHEISNPVLQKQYSMLQALALSEEAPEWSEDTDDALQPPAEMGHLAPLISEFFAGLPEAGSKPVKRKAPTGGASTAKKAKADVDTSSIDWPGLASEGKIEKQTMPVLKAFLKSKGLPVAGKKADLVGRVYDALSA